MNNKEPEGGIAVQRFEEFDNLNDFDEFGDTDMNNILVSDEVEDADDFDLEEIENMEFDYDDMSFIEIETETVKNVQPAVEEKTGKVKRKSKKRKHTDGDVSQEENNSAYQRLNMILTRSIYALLIIFFLTAIALVCSVTFR